MKKKGWGKAEKNKKTKDDKKSAESLTGVMEETFVGIKKLKMIMRTLGCTEDMLQTR